jgi:hypothetical protein
VFDPPPARPVRWPGLSAWPHRVGHANRPADTIDPVEHDHRVERRPAKYPVMDDDVYESETATNDRNRDIAHLLDGYGRMY